MLCSIAVLAAVLSLVSCGPKPPPSEESSGMSNAPAQSDDSPSGPADAPSSKAEPENVQRSGRADARTSGAAADARSSTKSAASSASAPPPSESADPLGPLPAAHRKLFENLPRDPKPEGLVRNSHYWVSNEFSHFLWRDEIKDKGGAYLGVGTDQNFLLAGWARSELIVIVDFDLAIIHLHRAYASMFERAKTPDELIAFWSSDSEDRVNAILDEDYAGSEELDAIKRAYRVGRASVSARLRGVKKRYSERGVPTFLTDQDEYDHIRKLWQNGRVYAVRGDYTANNTLVAVGKALEEADFELEVFYLSNVEQYIEYTPEVRRNILGLPFADDSVVLRTLGWKGFGVVEGETYHYALQPGQNFIGWLRKSRINEFPKLLYFRTKTDVEGYSKIEREPKVSKRPPEIAE
jgi:hypothetical protein